nr:methyl-accepting chemotaxis protein [Massilia sp. JS1662]
MRKLTVRSGLMAALLLFTLMIIAGAVLGMTTLGRANDALGRVSDIALETQTINDIYKDTTRTRSALTRAYLELKEHGMSGAASEALDSAKKSQDRSVSTLREFVARTPSPGSDVVLRKEVTGVATMLTLSLQKQIDALRHGDTAAYDTIFAKQIMPQGKAYSADLERLQSANIQRNATLMDQRKTEYRMVLWLVAIGLGIALLLVFITHVFLKRIVVLPIERAVQLLDNVARGDLTARVEDVTDNEIGRLIGGIATMQHSLAAMVSKVRAGAEAIGSAAGEVAAGNLDLSARTESQASALEETAATMEELTGIVKSTTDNTLQARQLVEAASTKAAAGGAVMSEMANMMREIDASSRKVVDIISVIDGIALQTNILALNAAVEAARAGEQGRGFAVVAAEVRTLAQRSAAAAHEIKALIHESVVKVGSGGVLTGQAASAMNDIVDSVERANGLVADIAEASREQSDGIAQVNKSIVQMDEVTQRNAALVEEAAAMTQSMRDETDNLLRAVSAFRLAGDELGGAEARARAHVTSRVPLKAG